MTEDQSQNITAVGSINLSPLTIRAYANIKPAAVQTMRDKGLSWDDIQKVDETVPLLNMVLTGIQVLYEFIDHHPGVVTGSLLVGLVIWLWYRGNNDS